MRFLSGKVKNILGKAENADQSSLDPWPFCWECLWASHIRAPPGEALETYKFVICCQDISEIMLKRALNTI